jgi:hypothetical protein
LIKLVSRSQKFILAWRSKLVRHIWISPTYSTTFVAPRLWSSMFYMTKNIFNRIGYIRSRANIYNVYFIKKVMLRDFIPMIFLIVSLSKKVLVVFPVFLYHPPDSPRTSCMAKNPLYGLFIYRKENDPLYIWQQNISLHRVYLPELP